MNIDKETMSFNLTKQDVKALAAFAEKSGSTRPHLACVRFEPNGTRGAEVIATDGHAIVNVSLKPHFARNSFSVPVEEFERSAKSLSPKRVGRGRQLAPSFFDCGRFGVRAKNF